MSDHSKNEYDENGRPILSLGDKIDTLEHCLQRDYKEDALGHLFDLIAFVAPNYIFRGEDFGFFGIEELQKKYGDPPVEVKMDVRNPIRNAWMEHAPVGAQVVMGRNQRIEVRVEPRDTVEQIDQQIEALNKIKEEAIANQDFEFAASTRDAMDELRREVHRRLTAQEAEDA